ncbi:MAG: 16S rRNA (cytosine(1402)-N(4))-methyltransferase RsmH [Dehalococcoidia bacterium]|nr:16S rRNA (cytosine(1402)-N(4))-methyltransferase RsmH [Dehalococcoidia bacterium]MDW8119777.1 16S rRNA (cytosine(1402)-N(4))-methyltransferase RsmH [Chloroflexota bacterium]
MADSQCPGPAPTVYHRPVLVAQVVEGLQVHPGGRYIDCTLGEGGHAQAILEASTPNGYLLGLEVDPDSLEVARQRLAPFGERALLVRASFAHLEEVARHYGWQGVDGILFDLGLSRRLLEASGRGFSFQREEPLDMRFDPRSPLTAHTIVNTWPARELARIFAQYGDERRAGAIARAIVQARPITSTTHLAQVVAQVVGRGKGYRHPATRVFQALRIAVNGELDALEAGLTQAIPLLRPGGRLVVIAYHSGEDRVVKQVLRREAQRLTVGIVTKKPITPSREEVRTHREARSARLRVAQRLAAAPGAAL